MSSLLLSKCPAFHSSWVISLTPIPCAYSRNGDSLRGSICINASYIMSDRLSANVPNPASTMFAVPCWCSTSGEQYSKSVIIDMYCARFSFWLKQALLVTMCSHVSRDIFGS